MITESASSKLRLEFFKELYETALTARGEELSLLDRYMEQYRGSLEIDGSEEKAVTVRNITYEIVESQVSSDIPQPKADPVSYSERRARCSESIERLCRAARDRLPFDELNDLDERYTYIYGGSVWYAEWEHSPESGRELGGVRVHCLSPKRFIPQPGIFSVSDMEYCFLRLTTTRGELMRKYRLKPSEADGAEYEYKWGKTDGECDTVTIVVCFYRDEEGDVGRFIFSGELVLSDIPRYYMRKLPICTRCSLPEWECRCGGKIEVSEVGYEEVPKSLLGDYLPEGSEGVLRVPYYVPRSFPIVIRKNTSAEDSLLGQSDCEYIRPEQQAINKLESRILKKLLLAGVTPVMPEDAAISLNNSVFGQIIKMKPGESLSQYGKVDTTPDIAQDIAEAERLYDHAKRIIGISDAYQGIDTARNESGIAKQLRISQATGRLESKRKMKHTAYAALDKLIFTLYLAFADEPRQLSYKDAFGRIHSAQFSRYDFIEYDMRRGEYYYDDSYLFSVDLNGGNEYQREALWERNLENLKAGTLGSPESPVTLLRYWQCQERAHYPHARENVEYFLSLVEREGGEGNV